MADTHKQWLDKLEAESRAKQELFMNDISAKLRHPRMYEKPQHPFRGAPDFWNAFEWTEEERIKGLQTTFYR
jgi:L-lactate dehydrogenase complex protein LldG